MSVLTDQELAFVFNFLGSEHVSIPGPQNQPVATIRQKIANYLQAKQAPAPEDEDGDSPDTAE